MLSNSSSNNPSEIVVDANSPLNAVIAVHPFHQDARALFGDCAASGIALIAPAWWEAEADSSLRRMVSAGYLTAQAAATAQVQLDSFPIPVD